MTASSHPVPTAATDRIRVLYIAGYGRSGSTLLERMLGQLPGIVACGELRDFWSYSLVRNRPCACGEGVETCTFWSRVMDEAFGGRRNIDEDLIRRQRKSIDRIRHVPQLAMPIRTPSFNRRLEAIRDPLEKLYRGIQTVSGSELIVDASKFPWYGLVLAALPQFDLRVVHLVRDPRGVAFSQMRHKQDRTGRVMSRKSSAHTSVFWDISNVAAHVLGAKADRYMRIRYEDFIEAPSQTLKRILAEMADIYVDDLPFMEGNVAQLGLNHTVAGNPIRFESGPTVVSLDLEWMRALPRGDRLLTTAATLPFLAMYGYGLGRTAATPAHRAQAR